MPLGSSPDALLPEEVNADLSGRSWDPFESEAFALAEWEPGLLPPSSLPHPVSLGEKPTVQDHFQALIKRRLRLEIERRPPLFPWEREVQDYPEWLAGEAAAPIWLDHLRDLKIPTVLPDQVMTLLLARCQELAQQPLKSGVRLIKAVENLFPDQPQTLDNVARLVLTPAYRSGRSEMQTLDYDSANTQQQVALAMMAAQEIFDSLLLLLSPQTPTATRHWLTPMGVLTLSASALGDGRLEVQAVLPQAGHLQLGAVRTELTQPGEAIARLDAVEPARLYSVVVGLADSHSAPLQFTLVWQDEPTA
jgi:hypothetical protein